MGRTGDQQNQDANNQMSAIQQDQVARANKATDLYNSDLTALKAQGNPYTNSAYKGTERLLAAEGAGAANSAGQEAVNSAVGASGTNVASRPYYQEMMAKNAGRAAGATLVGQNAQDTQSADAYQRWLLGADLAPAGVDTSMFGTATQGRDAALGNLTQLGLASYGPINSLITAAGSAAGAVGAAYCPAEGSMYLMADGTEKRVECLEVGEQIMGIDGEPQTIEEIQSALAPVIQVRTANGFKTRNSLTHAFALPKGGFVVSAKSHGKTIVTTDGNSEVVNVRLDGNAVVFNVITDGSHTYRADGVWALGVGEAERHVSMETWERVGRSLAGVN